MSVPDFYLCDICGERVCRQHRLCVATGRLNNDPLAEPVCFIADLCHTHAVLALAEMMNSAGGKGDFERGRQLQEYIKLHKRA